jgi:hypothetical protein
MLTSEAPPEVNVVREESLLREKCVEYRRSLDPRARDETILTAGIGMAPGERE